MTVVAYMRVSTDGRGQTTENQKLAIENSGFTVNKWYSEDGVSGSVKALDRAVFSNMIGQLSEGDVCIVTMVDRLGRTASDILHTVEEFKRLGIKLRVLQFDGMDITSSMGKMVLTCMAAMAELERNILIERTCAGLERTKAAGTIFGTKKAVPPDVQEKMYNERARGMSLQNIATYWDSNKMTVMRATKMAPAEYSRDFNARNSQHVVNTGKRAKG